MFTYGYIREATLAHLDIDETEAQAMNLLSRFHIFANEAMQAICSSKPMYQYIDITVVDDYAPLVMDGAFLRPATVAEINWDVETQGNRPFVIANEELTKKYYNEQNIYKKSDKVIMKDTFIAFASKEIIKVSDYKPSVSEQLEAEAFGYKLKEGIIKETAKLDHDFSYISKNQIKFYKTGRYLIPAKYMWYRFDSGISDNTELDMPSDILLTIPLYIASICLQIDNLQKAQLMRQEFEMALSRCTATDFMSLPKIERSW